MFVSHSAQEGKDNPPELRGIIPNTFEYIFKHIEESENKAFFVQASFLEIHNEEVHDLLGKNNQQKLELKEDPEKGPYVKGLTAYEVKVPMLGMFTAGAFRKPMRKCCFVPALIEYQRF